MEIIIPAATSTYVDPESHGRFTMGATIILRMLDVGGLVMTGSVDGLGFREGLRNRSRIGELQR